MDFNELKKIVNDSQNKKDFLQQILVLPDDEIEIVSSLYDVEICCGNVTSVNDIYDTIEKYSLDPEIFKQPYYLKAHLRSFDEKTINMINQLDDNVFVELIIAGKVDKEKLKTLLKISHLKVQFICDERIDLDTIFLLSNKYIFDEKSPLTLIISKFDSTTKDKVLSIYQKFNNPFFRIEINDAETLRKFSDIVPYITRERSIIKLNDNLFDENNHQNARNALFQATKKHIDKELDILYRNDNYDSMEQIYELEKSIGIIKSHIPKNASELDIVTYVTLFIINYFKYDYKMYENYIMSKDDADGNYEDINLTEFISNKKGVCRHFANFTKYALNSFGIECERIDSSGNDYTEGHAFNIVKIKGKSCFLDNTWIAGSIQKGMIKSLPESSDFLKSNEEFGHEGMDVINDYHCESYDRQEIEDSVNRVLKWNDNYIIHPNALRDLFKKHILKKESAIEKEIEAAIPRRK